MRTTNQDEAVLFLALIIAMFIAVIVIAIIAYTCHSIWTHTYNNKSARVGWILSVVLPSMFLMVIPVAVWFIWGKREHLRTGGNIKPTEVFEYPDNKIQDNQYEEYYSREPQQEDYEEEYSTAHEYEERDNSYPEESEEDNRDEWGGGESSRITSQKIFDDAYREATEKNEEASGELDDDSYRKDN